MPFRAFQARLERFTRPLRRALQYARYDWTREMPKWKRVITWVGILMQGYAVYCIFTRSLVWPVMWPHGMLLYASVWLIYLIGSWLMNGMLTSEFFRKTQLEADQIAARQIQQTLQPEKLDRLPGYELETFYKPFREVSGDYFDVIELAGSRTLFALADVSGKGMPAALLAANIQALVRSSASFEADPLMLAQRINRHLSRYSPSDRFATAVFIVLSRDSGELTYVNAGHNAPILVGSGPTIELEATGMPLGLFREAAYKARTALLSPGGVLLVFTDGLTDSISGENPEARLRNALADRSGRTMSILKSLINPEFNEDDVSILLVKRHEDGVSGGNS
ncbi:MAG TPA: PP2C family protein-serine/threonine phosphatase [Bryobacteraceae bacterium]|nr:PP2C family protein-serine/threonine phosphatase [Bryobacteraceae bacterium]